MALTLSRVGVARGLDVPVKGTAQLRFVLRQLLTERRRHKMTAFSKHMRPSIDVLAVKAQALDVAPQAVERREHPRLALGQLRRRRPQPELATVGRHQNLRTALDAEHGQGLPDNVALVTA